MFAGMSVKITTPLLLVTSFLTAHERIVLRATLFKI
jgi:hypothetical protein